MFKAIILLAALCAARAQNTGATHYSPCSKVDGRNGLCVPKHLCKADGTTNTNGEGIIDIRTIGGQCNYLSTCCILEDQLEQPPPPVPAEQTPQRKGCGWRNPQGVGMKTTGDVNGEAKFGEFPWMVGVLKYKPKNPANPTGPHTLEYAGGGSLIHRSAVLTVAHHIGDHPRLRVRAGDWDVRVNTERYPHQERNVDKIVVHDDFIAGTLYYDIALLFLETPMDLAPNVGIACLAPPSTDYSRAPAAAGTRCFTCGWGKTKMGAAEPYQRILKKLDVPLIYNRNCRDKLRQTRLGLLFELHTSFICAGGEEGKDMCRGDGGSPLVCPIQYEDGRYMQTGMAAWGIGCGGKDVPGVYVDVANLRGWIDDHMKAQRLYEEGPGFTYDSYNNYYSSF